MRTKLVLLIAVFLLLAGGVWLLFQTLPYGEELARFKRIHRNWDREYSRLTAADVDQAVVAHFDRDKFPNETARIDAVRSLVHAFSIRKLDTTISKHGDTITKMFAAQLQDPDAPKPKLLCDHQANIMIAILDALGIKARLVHAFSTRKAPDLEDHSFLEVLNPDTGSWEIQDPYFDVYWKNKKTGRRAVLLDLVMNDISDYTPCQGEVCDWSLNNIQKKRDGFFQAMVWDYSRDKKRSVCIINTRRFALDTVFDEARLPKKTFEEFLENWIDPIVIEQ